jgi:hypothetical protein
VLNEFKEESISWINFLAFFTKRGRYQSFAEISISPSKRKNTNYTKLGAE